MTYGPNSALALRKQDLDDLAELGQALVASGFFRDSTKVAQAAIKVLAGRELGLGPVESMRSFHIVEGKIEMSADLLAQRVKAHPDYDYRVRELTNEVCRIEFFGPRLDGEAGLESLGVSEFTVDDARQAGIVKAGGAWTKYPRAMCFARAMSAGVGFYVPDAAGTARVYSEGEVGGEEAPPTLSVVEAELADAGITDADLETLAGIHVDHPSGAIVVDTETGEIVEGSGASPSGESASGSEPHQAEAPAPAPSTPAQRTKLALLAKDLGWDDDERRARAGVASFTALTKTAASLLIEQWASLAEGGSGDPNKAIDPEPAVPDGEVAPPAPVVAESDPAGSDQWTRMLKHVARNKSGVLAKAKAKFGEAVQVAEDITSDQAAQLIEASLL